MATTVKSEVRKLLVQGVEKQKEVTAAENTLNAKREGMYVLSVKAAIKAKKREVFEEVIETLCDDFRFNRRGISEKNDVPQAKQAKTGKPKTDKDGNALYIVPGNLRTAKSVVLQAFQYGLDFGTFQNPTPFGTLRTLLDAAKEEEAKANRTPDDDARDVIRGVLDNVSKALDNVSGKRALTASLKLVQELADAIEKQAA